MKIGVCELISDLHKNSSFSDENLTFIRNIEEKLNRKIDIISIEEKCDLKIVFIESGGSERLFLNNINKLSEPFYLLTTGSNNSLAASLEILTYINSIGKKGEILHGSINYIASRIEEIING